MLEISEIWAQNESSSEIAYRSVESGHIYILVSQNFVERLLFQHLNDSIYQIVVKTMNDLKVSNDDLDIPAGLKLASEYIEYATEYMDALKILSISNCGVAITGFVASHSAELMLKGYLASKGFTEPELQSKKLRHNIIGLLSISEEHGIKIDNDIKYILEYLSINHKNFSYRYRKNGTACYILDKFQLWDKLYLLLEEIKRLSN